jgi:hypothetical protein
MGFRACFGLLACAVLFPAQAGACVQLTPLFTVSQAEPAADARNVPTNAPVLVHFDRVDQIGTSPEPGYWEPMVTIVDPDGVSSQLRATPLSPDQQSILTFVPPEPLRPEARYQVSVGDSRGNGEMYPPVTWDFLTGDEPRPPLTMTGALSVTLEPGMVPHYDCQPASGPSLCSIQQDCVQHGTDNVINARLELPGASGGFSDELLQAKLELAEYQGSADPQPFQTWALGPKTAEKSEELVQQVPIRVPGQGYVPCFTYTLTDARLDTVQTSWCAEQPFVPPAPSQPNAAQDPAPPDDTDAASGSHQSQACSIAAPGAANGTGSVWLVTLAVFTIIRRRVDRRP